MQINSITIMAKLIAYIMGLGTTTSIFRSLDRLEVLPQKNYYENEQKKRFPIPAQFFGTDPTEKAEMLNPIGPWLF